jgi:hypothetical protein
MKKYVAIHTDTICVKFAATGDGVLKAGTVTIGFGCGLTDKPDFARCLSSTR